MPTNWLSQCSLTPNELFAFQERVGIFAVTYRLISFEVLPLVNGCSKFAHPGLPESESWNEREMAVAASLCLSGCMNCYVQPRSFSPWQKRMQHPRSEASPPLTPARWADTAAVPIRHWYISPAPDPHALMADLASVRHGFWYAGNSLLMQSEQIAELLRPSGHGQSLSFWFSAGFKSSP